MGGWLRIRPGMHVDGNWPGLGVAAAVGRLLELSPQGTMTAINIAACQLPASLYLPITTGDNARNTYIAHSAWLGMLAAFSATAGITAPQDVLVHYADGYARAAQKVPDPEHSLLLEAYFKLHACVRHAHYGIEAARQIRVNTKAIQAIHLRVYEEAATYAGNRAPQAPIQAQFSLSFGLAAALRFGRLEPDTYRAPKFQDAELRRLEALVEVEPDRTIVGRAAELTVTANGKEHRARCERVPGDPGMAIEPAEIVAKFLRYSRDAVAEAKAAAFAAALMEEKDQRFAALWARLT
jgi:2-methylcitrate dehydratase PrpD